MDKISFHYKLIRKCFVGIIFSWGTKSYNCRKTFLVTGWLSWGTKSYICRKTFLVIAMFSLIISNGILKRIFFNGHGVLKQTYQGHISHKMPSLNQTASSIFCKFMKKYFWNFYTLTLFCKTLWFIVKNAILRNWFSE